MNPAGRPTEAAPGGMGGTTRRPDPSEAVHDRRRRGLMNLAFISIVLVNLHGWHRVGMHGWDWLGAVMMAVAAAPLGLAAKVFELRFKMADAERVRLLRELPGRKQTEFVLYALLAVLVPALNPERAAWALLGMWGYDFVTYYHDRSERLRHLYAVAKTLDELRTFPAPWAWTVPALIFEIGRRLG